MRIKCRWAIRIVGILQLLGEIQLSRAHRLDVSEPCEAGGGSGSGEDGSRELRLRRIVRGDDCRQRPLGIIFARRARVHAASDQACLRSFGRPFHDKFDPAAGRNSQVVLPENAIPSHSVLVDRHAIERHNAQQLAAPPLNNT